MNKNQLDVVYDPAHSVWRCCSNNSDGSTNCTHPTKETFSAPAPSALKTSFADPALAVSSSLSAPTETSPSSSSNGPGSLSLGDKIALAVGIPGVAASLIGAWITYFAMVKRKRRQAEKQKQPDLSRSDSQAFQVDLSTMNTLPPGHVKELYLDRKLTLTG